MISIKILLLSLILLGLVRLTLCQDIIIRNNGDTVHCAVTQIDSNVIYFKVKRQNESIMTSLNRNEIKDFLVPVAPDNPVRIMCEKKITHNSLMGVLGGVGFLIGGGLILSGASNINNSGLDVITIAPSQTDEGGDLYMKGMRKIVAGTPFAITGGIIGTMGLLSVVKYRKQLQNLYNLSLIIDSGMSYKGITLCFRF